jgi:hypothetical protein
MTLNAMRPLVCVCRHPSQTALGRERDEAQLAYQTALRQKGSLQTHILSLEQR